MFIKRIESFPFNNPKAMMFIHDDNSKIVKANVGSHQCLRTDNDMNFSGGDSLQRFPSMGTALRSCNQINAC